MDAGQDDFVNILRTGELRKLLVGIALASETELETIEKRNRQNRERIASLADASRRMPNQLFVQSFFVIDLVLKVIEESIYYVQRMPPETRAVYRLFERGRNGVLRRRPTAIRPSFPHG